MGEPVERPEDAEPLHLDDEADDTPPPPRPKPSHRPPPGEPMTLEEDEPGPAATMPTPTEPVAADEIEVIDVDEEPAEALPEEPAEESDEVSAEQGAAPAEDTVRMSLADATKAWVEDSPQPAGDVSEGAPAPASAFPVARAVVVLVLLAAAIVIGLLFI